MAQQIRLNMTPGSMPAHVHVSQSDNGRVLTFILEEGKDAYEIPEGSIVKFVGTKPSGLGFQLLAEYGGNIAKVTVEDTMTNERGEFEAELRITDGNDGRIGSANVIVVSEKDPHPDNTTDGDAEPLINELTQLLEAIGEKAEEAVAAKEAAEAAQAGAQAAQAAAEAAKTAAQTAKTGAETAKTGAQAAQTAAEAAQAGAETAKTGAETAQAAAEAAKRLAQTAQTAAETARTGSEAARDLAEAAQAGAETAQAAAEAAKTGAQAAQTAAETAQAAAEAAQAAAEGFAEDAEAWSVGQRGGTDVESTDETYHNNAKFYSQQSANSASQAAASAQAAEAAAQGYKRYGVTGIGQSASALTRTYDAIGKVAQVGTDGDNTNVKNDFDNLEPFNRRKCVGRWYKENGRAVFRVNAYLGDADYAEDGSMGDYVAVECPRAYYYMEDGELIVSSHQYAGYKPFDIFCRDHNPNDLLDFVYLPAYMLALDESGKAVCLPGLRPEQGHYKKLVDAARTYANEDVAGLGMLQPAAVNFYEWALFTVEFAVQNAQTVMRGCADLRSANSEEVHFIDQTHAVVPYYAARVPGEHCAITTNTTHYTVNYMATHEIVAIERCDQSGTPNPSGSYQLLTLRDLGAGYFNYDTETTYYFGGRPWPTGACNDVSTPSGSPVSNVNGYYPMKYRHRENVYANQYHTIMDLFNKRVQDENEQYYLEHYLLKDPKTYIPASASKPDATDLATDAFAKLDIETGPEIYTDGWIKSRKYSDRYPDIWVPDAVTGGSATTYFADYAYLVNSYTVRAVRLGGSWYFGPSDGFSHFFGNSAPSSGFAYYGGDLCFAQ